MKKIELEGADAVDLAGALGAAEENVSRQVLSLYIPNKDKEGREFGMQRKWILEAAGILEKIGGGFTIMPPTEGGWFNEESGETIWENPVVIYTYIVADRFAEHLPELRELLHRMGRETNQGEVAVEFDGRFFRIGKYDGSPEESRTEGKRRSYATPVRR